MAARTMMRLFASTLLVITLGASTLWSSHAAASTCDSKIINPLSDIAWECIFPLRIGGMAVVSGSMSEGATDPEPLICLCEGGLIPRVGLKVQFWEPVGIVDTVVDSGCMMPLGAQLNLGGPGGGIARKGALGAPPNLSAQTHYFRVPLYESMALFMDIPCLTRGGFDTLFLSELDPSWDDATVAGVLHPESVLFGNPIAKVACMADAAQALHDVGRDDLYWCMGAWGSGYPLSGTIGASDRLEAMAGLAGRTLFKMTRLGMLKESSDDGCYTQYRPAWTKSKYRLQMWRPSKDRCRPIGRDGLLWSGGGKRAGTNLSYSAVVFRKNDCCVSY